MPQGFTPRLGYTYQQIRDAHSSYKGESYAQVERRLFFEDTHREPTIWDYLYAWWHFREDTIRDRRQQELIALGYEARRQ